jgi:hypothetical protein
LLAVIALASAAALAAGTEKAPSGSSVPVEYDKLGNGLKVVLLPES